MNIPGHILGLAVALCGALLAAGCGDSPEKLGQANNYNRDTHKYQGKPDTRPFENAPSAYSDGSSWPANDRTGWETALRRRQQNQNDYLRAN
jgi:hypothetical protein